jgi:hypothetical protein
VVFGILQTNTYGWGLSRVWLYVALGVLILAGYFVHARAREPSGSTPAVSIRLFRNRTSNLGLLTQNVQWLVLQGIFFVISVFLQQERGYSAIQTGLTLVPATIGILLSSGMAQRPGHRHRGRHRSATARPCGLRRLPQRVQPGVVAGCPGRQLGPPSLRQPPTARRSSP